MKTKKAEATQKAILSAAGELFEKQSVAKVSVNAIVKKAGVAKGTFYLYYESKDDVVWDYIENNFSGANEWLKGIVEMPYNQEGIERYMSRMFDYIKKHITVLRVIHDARFLSFFGTKRLEDKYFKQWLIPIQMWLKKGMDEGVLGIRDPEFMAYYLLMTVHHMCDRVLLKEVPFDYDTLESEMGALLWRLIKP